MTPLDLLRAADRTRPRTGARWHEGVLREDFLMDEHHGYDEQDASPALMVAHISAIMEPVADAAIGYRKTLYGGGVTGDLLNAMTYDYNKVLLSLAADRLRHVFHAADEHEHEHEHEHEDEEV